MMLALEMLREWYIYALQCLSLCECSLCDAKFKFDHVALCGRDPIEQRTRGVRRLGASDCLDPSLVLF